MIYLVSSLNILTPRYIFTVLLSFACVCLVSADVTTQYLLSSRGIHCPIPGKLSNEPWHEISNNVVCATSKGLDQTRRLIRAFAYRLNIL